MPYFHATHRQKLPSIWQFGLGGLPTAPQNFPCESGVYLATSPEIAFGFLIENYIRSGKPGSNPSAEIDEFVVIVVDDSRVTGSIRVDPQIPSTDAKCFLYEGVIDVRGMPVLDAIAIFPEHRGADSL